MTVRDRRFSRAVALSRSMAANARKEITEARIAAGVSRADVGRAVGMSASQVDRFERGTLDDVRLGSGSLLRP